MIGLTFCGEVNSPSTLASNQVGFPLNGNMKVEISIEREDVSEYHFKAALSEPSTYISSIMYAYSNIYF